MTKRRQDGIHNSNYSHGMNKTRLFRIYHHMKNRCYKSYNKSYKRYGARGISICQEWLDDPAIFFNWAVKNGYTDELEIDRIDNDGNYEPSNCRWVTHKVNSQNRSSTKLSEKDIIEIRSLRGKMYQTEIAKLYGISRSHLQNILYGKKWGNI